MDKANQSHTNCIILTNTIPIHPYRIQEGYMLKAVEASNQMFEGFSMGVPHGQPAVVAFPYFDAKSYNIYRDFIIFHSFISDDSSVYIYAQHIFVNHKSYEDRELIFLDFSSDHKLTNTESIRLVDFDQFPITLWNPENKRMNEQKNANHELSPDSKGSSFLGSETGSSEGYDDPHARLFKSFYTGDLILPLFEEKINYSKAFNLFREFKHNKKTRRLYNQIGLYVFTRNIRDLSEIYQNDYATITLYIAILESIAGKPPICPGQFRCSECGSHFQKEHKVSWERWLMDKYGNSFKNLREIRHKFIHEVDSEDITDAIAELYDKKDDRCYWLPDDFKGEERLFNISEETEILGTIIRNNLTEIFLKQYEQ